VNGIGIGTGAGIGLLVAATLLPSCGDESAPMTVDAGATTDGAASMPAPPAEPAEAAWPSMTPCSAGWVEATDASGATVCMPWSEPAPAACAAGEALFPGGGCARVGTECAADGWPTGLPTDRPILYVRADAAAGGTGARDAPFARIADAMAAASAGTIVAVATGTYDEDVRVRGSVTLWGACVAETLVTSTRTSEMAGTVSSGGAGAAARNLRISGARIGVSVVGAGATLDLDDVAIDGASNIGILVALGGHVSARSLVVRNVSESDGVGSGRGINVQSASIEIERGVVEHTHLAGVFVTGEGSPGTTATLSGVAIRDIEPDSGGFIGHGLHVRAGALVTASDLVVERATELGVAVTESGTSVSIMGALVRDIARGSSGDARGVFAGEQASIDASRIVIERLGTAAVVAVDRGTTLRLTDAIVRDSTGDEVTHSWGNGIVAGLGATFDVERAVLRATRSIAIGAADDGTSLTLQDVRVLETQVEESSGERGRALQAQSGATLHGTRIELRSNREVSALAGNPGTALALEDLVVSETAADPRGQGGIAVSVQEGATATLTRARVEGSYQAGVYALGGEMMLTDVTVRDTRSRPSDGQGGRGVGIELGAKLVASRVAIETSHEVALAVLAAGSSATLEDVTIADTMPAECAASTCPGFGAGSGVVAADTASIEMRRFVITRNALTGVSVVQGGVMDLHEGEISHNVIGANADDPMFDLSRIQDRVRYIDNGRDYDATILWIPPVLMDVRPD